MGGHLEALVWAREQGCPWNEYTVFRRRFGRAPQGVEVGAGPWVPVDFVGVRTRR
jgi:hypothetical protein